MKAKAEKVIRRLGYSLIMVVAAGAYGLTDPTKPAYYSERDSSYLQSLQKNYHLSAVMVRPTHRVATINGIQVREGESIGEAVVRKIDKSSVRLVAQGAVFTISLTRPFTRKKNNTVKRK